MFSLKSGLVGLGLALGAPPSLIAQDSVTITGERLVYADPRARPLVEPHLAVNPRDANHLVAGVIAIEPDYSRFDCVALVSFDGGTGWEAQDFGFPQCGDPWVAVLADGTALYTMLASPSENADPQLLVYRSVDGGRTWSQTAAFGQGPDHQTVAVDHLRGRVYVVAQRSARREETNTVRSAVFVARSDDGGQTFSTTDLFPFALSFNTMSAVVLRDGALIVPISDYGRPGVEERQIRLEPERDWIVRSDDGGSTFTVPLMITDACAVVFPVLAADGSDGPHADRLYYVCTDRDYRNVFLHYSADGVRWSLPQRVNVGSGLRGYARIPTVAVDDRGVVAVSWYDARNDRARFRGIFRCQQLYLRVSLDGAASFLDEVAVSSEPSCPNAPGNGTVGERFPAGGDYHGLTAIGTGRFRMLWADSRSGTYQLWTAVATVTGLVR